MGAWGTQLRSWFRPQRFASVLGVQQCGVMDLVAQAARLGPEGSYTELALLLKHACCMLWWQGPEDPLVGPSDLCC